MISVAISMPEDGLATWIAAASNTESVREVELAAATLQTTKQIDNLLDKNGLRVVHVRQFLPNGFTRHFLERIGRSRNSVFVQLKTALVACRAHGARRVSLDLQLDQVAGPPAELDTGIRLQVSLIRPLLPAAIEAGITLCIPVRYPYPFPGSREWGAAENLVYEIMHPACRLGLNLFPAELDADFDLIPFLRNCFFHLDLIRLHYSPALGETLSRPQQESWADGLRRHGFKGCVIFCPVASGETGIRDACREVDLLAPLYK